LQSVVLATPSPSDHLKSSSIALDKSAIVAFASRFDPQPYHLDADAADQSIFGGLCASGWHIAALATRLVIETLLDNGLPFVEMTTVSRLKWHRPTFVNEQISVRVALRASQEESPIANTRCQTLEIEVCNGNGAVVATMTATAAIAIDSALATLT
jgi:acyl dehydratase